VPPRCHGVLGAGSCKLCVPFWTGERGHSADGAVLDRQRFAAVEHDAVAAAEADALDGEAAQADRI
jgi:hypothetical protein